MNMHNKINLSLLSIKRIYIIPHRKSVITPTKKMRSVCVEFINEEDVKTRIFQQGDMVLVDGKGEYLKNLSKILREKNVAFDHIQHWITDTIYCEFLKWIGISEYVDFDNNSIVVHEYAITENVQIQRKIKEENCISHNNTVVIKNGILGNVKIYFNGDNSETEIGENTTIRQALIDTSTGVKIFIGNDCMFSSRINILAHDGHPIFELSTGKRINYPKKLVVGNHVWIGQAVSLLAGAEIPDNCIVGYGSVTSHRFSEKNTIIAGNPAKVIRHDIIWSADLDNDEYDSFDETSHREAKKYL